MIYYDFRYSTLSPSHDKQYQLKSYILMTSVKSRFESIESPNLRFLLIF